MYIIFISIKLLNDIILKNKISKKISYIIIPILSLLLVSNEVIIYKEIGNYHKQRIKEINEYLKSPNDKILYLTKIPKKYHNYHMDINLPDKDWFTYDKFINYYNLPKDIEIVYIDKE